MASLASLKRAGGRRLVMDVGASAVRLCELSQTKSGFQLTKYYQREFPIDPSMDDDQRTEIRVDVIRELLKEAKARGRKVIFGVPGQSVFTRTRHLPPVPEYKVNQIVRYEIQQQIPFSLDQIAYDFQVLERTEAGGYDVLMAAIKVDVVDKQLEIIRAIKKQVEVVDVAPLSAYNWLKYTGEFGEEGECVALVDMGATTTDIVIEREGKFRFTRSLNLGGNDITSAIAKDFNMEWAEAEKLKRERGFAPTGDPQRDGKGGQVIGGVLNRLISEVNRSFAYFRSQPGGGPVTRVVVTGGGACLRNIVPFLQRQLSLEVRIAQPLAGLAIAPGAQEVNERPEQAAVALGLALRCRDNVTLEINLIPPRVLEMARRKEQLFYWALSAATVGLILMAVIPLMVQRNKEIEREIDLVKQIVAQYDPRLAMQPENLTPSQWPPSTFEDQLKTEKNKVDEFRTKLELMDEAYTGRIEWIKHLNAVNDARPKGKLLVFQTVSTTFIGPAQQGGSRGGGAASPGLGDQDDPRDRRDRGNNRGAFGLAASGAGSSLGDGGSRNRWWSSDVFKGIGGGRGGAIMGGAGSSISLGGRDDDDDDRRGRRGGGGGRGTTTGRPAGGQNPMQPVNGFRLIGYARDIETVREFVDNLEDSDDFLEGKGVYLDPISTKPVPFTVLISPAQAGPAGGGFGGGVSSFDDSDDDRRGRGRGRRGGLSALGGGGANFGNRVGRGANASLYYNPEQGLVSFTIDVQFAGKPVEQPDPNAPKARPAGVSNAEGGNDVAAGDFMSGSRRRRMEQRAERGGDDASEAAAE